MTLTPTIIICMIFVLSILLKLKAAPDTKNTKIQKLKLRNQLLSFKFSKT